MSEEAISREEAERHAAGDPTLQMMLKKGMPLTREMWKQANWGADVPSDEDWNAEHEMEVPECFRDLSSLHPMKKNYDVD
jgi:hypothetical protein